jgi:two-component system sensor histidine kinase UhpB
MNEIMDHVDHLIHFDGIVHWCFLIAVLIFAVGVCWVTLRVLLPLKRLVKQSRWILEGNSSPFKNSTGGIREIDELRRSLCYMLEQIELGREREAMYRDALTQSQENERMRIAHEIHDDTIQSLVLVSHNLERATYSAKNNKRDITDHLDNARNQLQSTVDSLRQMIMNLRPTILDDLGLVAAIDALRDNHPVFEFVVSGENRPISHTQELALFRTVQEAISNAERHASPHHVIATLRYSKAHVSLEICDDGVGFQVPPQLQEFANSEHYGLIGLYERITHLGGQFKIDSQPRIGTRLAATFEVVSPAHEGQQS